MLRKVSLLFGFISVVGFLWITCVSLSLVSHNVNEINTVEREVYGKDVHTFYIDKRGHDVLVFVQIPYTGESDLSTLPQNGLIYGNCPECITQRDCPCHIISRESVLFSSIKHPWPCGEYPGLRTLEACIGSSLNLGVRRRRRNKMRYLYMTLLRYPAHHFYHEWNEVKKHGWPKWSQVPSDKLDHASRECRAMSKGKDVSFKTFAGCPQNPAINRQTQMLANMSLDECLSTTKMSEGQCYDKMLSSAKDTLKHMAFFGITEYSYMTQVLFEETFQLKVIDKYVHPPNMQTFMSSYDISREEFEAISTLNKYDFLLYDYAQELFFERYDTLVTYRGTEA
ncbi:heparan-sulfate 6-O-sulfotransferase 2-like isoform X2 [Haliotis rufescens]|uniref:heparan-sulfate 6-O-sulfotransferase 2-like isoform X2 n=1 Tax=Haliotis rufescens TaxID=6454 RepID=UPI00201ED11D|nr:heparan-sulfate 6-O-sulfotransferase 2-like isoform X2 [Haliotis rufescens]